MRNLEETFEYDNQNRLKRVRLGPTLTGASVYGGYDHQRIFMEEHVGNRHRTKITGPVVDNIPIPTFWIYGKPYYIQPSVHWGGPFDFHFSNTVYIKP